MADNYLERQMEQYQARKAAWERQRKLGKQKPNKPQQNGNVSQKRPFYEEILSFALHHTEKEI